MSITANITVAQTITCNVTVDRSSVTGLGGDMTKAVYDPNSVEDDAFDMSNMIEGADAKVMTAAERTKLAGIETGAEVNNISDVNATDLTDAGESTLHYHASDRSRANHTGTQAESTITSKAEYAGIICSGLTEDLESNNFAGYLEMPFAGTLIGVKSSLKEAPTDASLIANLQLGGVDVTGADTTILAGTITSGIVTLATPLVFVEGDIFSVDRTQVGSTNTGKGHIFYLIITR